MQEDINFRTGTDTGTFKLIDRNRYINEGYSRVASIIIKSDGRMQWDDSNHTNAPVAVTDLVASQKKYNILAAAPDALKDWLCIERLEIDDASGNGLALDMIDHKDFDGIAESEYKKDASIPDCFDFHGTEVLLYPPPNYNATSGLRVYFKRAPSYFAVSDTSKRPGFASIFHPYLSIYASHQWNLSKKKDGTLQALLDRMEQEIATFYSRRASKVEQPRIGSRHPKMIS